MPSIIMIPEPIASEYDNVICRPGDVGGGVQDPDQPHHQPRLPASLLGPSQHRPQLG